MFILKKVVHETIWGGKKLTPFAPGCSEKIGHLYSANCNEKETNYILTGEWAGHTLNEYFDANKERFGLGEYAYFPLVIAMVEAADDLSIQVHPDDETAPILNPAIRHGKNESWYFIDPPESGSIYAGCLSASMEELRRSINTGEMEAATDRLPVKKGDYVHVVAGTLHSMARGSLVYEIEENAGCTYRFYDFDRIDKDGKKRPLQIPEAFYSIHLGNKPVTRRYDADTPIEERRFITRHFDSVSRYRNESDTLQVFTVLSGECEISGIMASCGTSIVLEPGDELNVSPVEAMVAQPKNLCAEQ